MKKLYLVDISSLFFRAFYAIRPLNAPSGLPVNAIYGVLSMIVKLLKDEKPEYIVFCYDRKEPSFRKDLYEDYKANRSEMPDDLGQQIPVIKKLIDLLGMPTLEVPSFEADDLIGTLCILGLKNNFEVIIVSGDKDFAQLVQPGVIMWDTMKETRIDEKAVIEKWGIPATQFIDYLALVGDSSDNIPGVEGIGPKGAVKLLEKFKSIEDLYARIDEVDNQKLKEKLLNSKSNAILSKQLVTITTDVKVDPEMSAYHRKDFKVEELRTLFHELNFKSFEKVLLDDNSHHISSYGQAAAVTKSKNVEAKKITPESMPSSQSSAQESGLKLETWQGLKSLNAAEPFYAFLKSEQIYLMQKGKVFGFSEDQADQIADLFCGASGFRAKAYDAKEIWHFLKCDAEKIRSPEADLMLMAYAVKGSDSRDFYKTSSSLLMEEVNEEDDVLVNLSALLRVEEVLKEELVKTNSEKFYRELDLPLARILYRMEKRGIALNQKALAEFSEELGTELASLEKKVHAAAGQEFNIASPKQLGQILFEKLGLEATKKTKTGYSTDTDVLEKLDHPIAPLVLQYRELSKLKSTYVDALPLMVNATTGRIHTHLKQAYTATGRLSSINPNLQNIPIRTPRGQRVRQAFVADGKNLLLSADYSQIELRILAHISNDPGLRKAFQEDLDIHTATAAEIFSVKLSDVTSELRRTAKAVNFGIAYGQGAFGLAEVLGIPRGEAQGVIKRYFEKFKGVQEYMAETVKKAYENGYVETLLGRRRYIIELQSKNPALKKFGERAAINAPIQGTASDLVKKTMLDLDAQVPLSLLLQVHDELIFEGSEDELEKWKNKIVEIMESAAKLSVPLKVNASIGPNWDEAH